jgi:hypothetical protein
MKWHIGHMIDVEVLKQKRAAYDQEIVATLSQQLSWTIRPRVRSNEPDADGAVYAAAPRPRLCCDAVATIELIAPQGDPAGPHD